MQNPEVEKEKEDKQNKQTKKNNDHMVTFSHPPHSYIT